MPRRGGPLLAGLLLAACGGGEEPGGPAPAPYTVLGRWPGPPDLVVAVEPEDTARGRALAAALAEAATAWSATGAVRLRVGAAGAPADVTFGWREGAHDDCPPFLPWTGVLAHAAPPGPGTFVHVDAGLDWFGEGEEARSLAATCAHELGHVLGLGHTTDPAALLHGGYDGARTAPAAPDLAGLFSLYGGGGPSGPNDLAVARLDATGAPTRVGPLLREALPDAPRSLALLDHDWDGRDELVVCAGDAARPGTFLSYHWNDALELEATTGPMEGFLPVGAAALPARRGDGAPALVLLRPGGDAYPVAFNDKHVPVLQVPPDEAVALVDGRRAVGRVLEGEVEARDGRAVLARADVDGDGRADALVAEEPGRARWWLARAGAADAPGAYLDGDVVLVGDLDGDGRPEAVLDGLGE